jgi:hypothetical protein
VAIVTSNGTISLLLHHQVRVDMTVDRGIRVFNFKVSDLSAVNKYGNFLNALQMLANTEIIFHLVIAQKTFLPRTLKIGKIRFSCVIIWREVFNFVLQQ